MDGRREAAMTAINRGSCFWCGEKVGDEEWDYVGPNRVWICDKSECNRELRNEQRGAEEHRFLDAVEDSCMRY